MGKCQRCRGAGRIPDYFSGLGGQECEDCQGSGDDRGSSQVSKSLVPADPSSRVVNVVGGRAMSQAIQARWYGYIESCYCDQTFPVFPPDSRQMTLEIVRPDKPMSTLVLSCALSDGGMRPADIWELMAFAETITDDEVSMRKFRKVVALGTLWHTPNVNSSSVWSRISRTHYPVISDHCGISLCLSVGDPVTKPNGIDVPHEWLTEDMFLVARDGKA